MKLLIGGSPCTFWSIAKKHGRESMPKGRGWELFKNFLIAKEKYKPDFFLYENNKSVAQPIKDQIAKEFGVELQYINSSSVSAQNRQRFYVHNIPNVPQPEDRGILLRDIIESGMGWQEKAYCLTASYGKAVASNSIHAKQRTMIAEVCKPIRIGYINKGNQGERIYSIDGTSICLSASSGGSGAKTGLYAVPINDSTKGSSIYLVKDRSITIRDRTYPIQLEDGFYSIRKLTITECKRLQTVPEEYQMPCSATQNYRMLGNGWTVDVIAHILSYIPNLQKEEMEVLSMYDGMSCGRIALHKLGVSVRKYYAMEIDKYALQTSRVNYPDIIQLGDAFQVRDSGWLPDHP